jgi:hypothetical protein
VLSDSEAQVPGSSSTRRMAEAAMARTPSRRWSLSAARRGRPPQGLALPGGPSGGVLARAGACRRADLRLTPAACAVKDQADGMGAVSRRREPAGLRRLVGVPIRPGLGPTQGRARRAEFAVLRPLARPPRLRPPPARAGRAGGPPAAGGAGGAAPAARAPAPAAGSGRRAGRRPGGWG